MKEKEITTEAEISKLVDRAWKPFLLTLAGVSLLGAIYVGARIFNKRSEALAQEQLFEVQKKLEKKEEELMNDVAMQEAFKKRAKKNSSTPELPPQPEKTPDSLAKNFAEVIQGYEDFIQKNSGKKASFIAAMELAGLATKYNDLALAEKTLSHVVAKLDSDIFSGLIRSQLASVYMDQKKFKEAIEQLKMIVADKELAQFHAVALLRLGVSQIQSGDFTEAEKTLDTLVKEHDATQSAAEGRKYKKLLSLKKDMSS